ncbi:MAG TPA: ATP-binding cassette domain-containing protein [Solirubrobacteraceae bacterium]|nr:ATP-binding cassette domain-containing protein [Solirubrobacteraceae bacterium]
MNKLKLKGIADPTTNGHRPALRSVDGRVDGIEIPAVEVLRLRKTYPGGVEAVKGIDFEVAPGEVFGLLGPNGAGKSTTIGMLTTTVKPTSGSARLAGYDVATEPLLARSVSSVVFQDAVVDGALSGRANLELHGRLWGVAGAQANRRIADLVGAVGLSELIDRPVSSYSGGQRRRLEIARALVSAPRVLFLDEPTVGLDPRIRHELLDVIVGLRNREAMTIVVTTHYLDEAQRLCDRVAIIHQGEIVALDSPQALLAGLGREILEFRVTGSAEAAVGALRDHGVAHGDSFSIGARVTVPLHEHAATEALAVIDSERLRVSEIATRVPTLDDVYLQLTGARIDDAA